MILCYEVLNTEKSKTCALFISDISALIVVIFQIFPSMWIGFLKTDFNGQLIFYNALNYCCNKALVFTPSWLVTFLYYSELQPETKRRFNRSKDFVSRTEPYYFCGGAFIIYQKLLSCMSCGSCPWVSQIVIL